MKDATHPQLSVVIPTTQPWPFVEPALASALAQDCDEPYEILLVDGHGGGLAAEPDPPVRWLRLPGADAFALRAMAVAASRGEVVAISEDHCLTPPDWCRQTLAAHRANAAAALIGPVSNHGDSNRSAVDRASFLLTLGPFTPPLVELTRERLPVPTNISFKRRALPAGAPAPGWLEYQLLAELRKHDDLGLAAGAVVAHRQTYGGLAALRVHFQSGRSYGSSTRAWPAQEQLPWFLDLARLPRRMFRMTRPALDRGAGGAPPKVADRGWLSALILANVCGQLAGALAGAGESRRWI